MVRQLNASRVLAVLRDAPEVPWSSNDLVEETGMSRPTVLAAADHLVDLGWVTGSVSRAAAGRGRPCRAFAFRRDAGYVLGVDIGARTVRVAVADLTGRVVAEDEHAFGDPGMPSGERLETVTETAAGALEAAGVSRARLLAACAGSSGTVAEDGTVRVRSGIPDFVGVNLPDALGRAFGCAVVAENDCNLAVIAERWRGVASGSENVVCMLAGERLGAGIVVHGGLVRGHQGGAGELGFLSLMGGSTAAEGLASRARTEGRRLVDAVAARAGGTASPDSPGAVLHTLARGDSARVDAPLVFEAMRRGDTALPSLAEHILGPAARAIATVSLLLDPELVVIGGAVADAGDVLLAPLRDLVGRLSEAPPRLEFSPLTDRAVVLGAVRLALDTAQARFQDPLAPTPSPRPGRAQGPANGPVIHANGW
ncbi:ROK family transcriptional regulator [Streptomyces sp. 130]|uniref:ROK family transcriptional regulator n=1 Tax=Streptomyces sp. 130 TaxID=2591006 RepID=UPI00163D8B6E|nr:ROK family transcriptional regulator [Streptomyces sp. 130]